MDLINDDDFDSDDEMMSDVVNSTRTNGNICCGRHGLTTNTVRGSPATFCQIITEALTSNTFRDSLDMQSVQRLLFPSNIWTSEQLELLCYFSDTRMNLLNDYVQHLMINRQHLKSIATFSDSEQITENVGDVLHKISQFTWSKSTPSRLCKGASGSTIIVAVNEAISCLNEITILRIHAQSHPLQQLLIEFIEATWTDIKMCRDLCMAQKQYRQNETVVSNRRKTTGQRKGPQKELPSTVEHICLDLVDLVVDDSPLNSAIFLDCTDMDVGMIHSSNLSGKRSRANDDDPLTEHDPLQALQSRLSNGNMSPSAKALLLADKLQVIKQSLKTFQSEDPQLIAEVVKTILSEFQSSPVIVEVATILKNEISACQSLYHDNKELAEANNNLDEAHIEDNLKLQADLLYRTCPVFCASLAACLMSSNLSTRIQAAYGEVGMTNLLRNRPIEITNNNTLKNLNEKGNASDTRIQFMTEEAHKDICRLHVRRTACCTIISNILNLRSEGQTVTIYTIFLGIIMKIGGLTNKGFDALSKIGIGVSDRKMSNTLDDVVNRKLLSTREWLESKLRLLKGGSCNGMFVVGMDNFNPFRFKDMMMKGDVMSILTYSLSLIATFFTFGKNPKMEREEESLDAMPDITPSSIDALLPFLENGDMILKHILTPDILDQSSPSLTKFTNLPSLHAKSSSKIHTLQMFLGGVCTVIFCCGLLELTLTIDPEPMKLILYFVFLLGAKGPFKNLITPPVPFHMQEHLMKGLFKDVTAFVLVIVPFLKWIGHRPTAYKNLQKSLIKKLQGKGNGLTVAESALFIQNTVLELQDIIEDEAEHDGDDSDAEDQENDVCNEENINVDENVIMINADALSGLQVHQVDPLQLLLVLGAYMADDLSKKDVKLQPVRVLSEQDQIALDLAKSEERKKRREAKKLAKEQGAVQGAALPKSVSTTTKATEKAIKEKKERAKKEKSDQFISTKKLKHYLDGLFIAVERMRPELELLRRESTNPLKLYALSVLLDQLNLTMAPFHDYVKGGKLITFYERFPHMITYLAWNGHTTLIKAYMFNLLCINHWRNHRPDILCKLAVICKWLNDVYIEHHHSVMARILKRLFPNNFVFPCIRWSSIFATAARGIWNIVSRITFTQCPPTSISAELEDVVFATVDQPYNSEHSLLRKADKTTSVIVTNELGVAASASSTKIAIKEQCSEPLQQLCQWEHNNLQIDHVCTFIRALLLNLDALDKSVITTATAEEALATSAMNEYRPLDQCKKYAPYSMSLFTTYLANAREADNKLIELRGKTELYRFLESHTVKDTLKPLLIRLQRRALKGELATEITSSSSEMMRIDCDEQQNEMLELDYPPLKLHSSVDRGLLQTRGQSGLKKDQLVALICKLIINVLSESSITEKKIAVNMHKIFVKKVLMGEGDDEPKIQCNEDKVDKKPSLDALSMWEETKKSVLPTFEKTFWQKLMKH